MENNIKMFLKKKQNLEYFRHVFNQLSPGYQFTHKKFY